MISKSNSNLLFERACVSIPGGVPGFHRLFESNGPLFLQRGDGAYVYDYDGRRYLDFVLGKGPVILGHAHPSVTRRVSQRLGLGNLLPTSTVEHIEAAELILQHFPSTHQVRFHKSGSEACLSAVKICRKFTGRSLVLSCGYHGWHDWSQEAGPSSHGDFVDFGYDLAHFDRIVANRGSEVAAIIVEPVPGFFDPSFYQHLSNEAMRIGALLVMDEVKSGFRTSSFTLQREVGVFADVTVMSKAISNGFCLSCVVGHRDFLKLANELHVASTFDLESVPLAAACQTLIELSDGDLLRSMESWVGKAVELTNQVFSSRGIAAKSFRLGTSFRICFADIQNETEFFGAILEKGVLMYPFDNQFVSAAHGNFELEFFCKAVDEVCSGREWSGIGWNEVYSNHLHQFQNRKGFLKLCPGPFGRKLANSFDLA